MNEHIQAAIDWIAENFPPPKVSALEAKQIHDLAIGKSTFIRYVLIDLLKTWITIGWIGKFESPHIRPLLPEVFKRYPVDYGEQWFTGAFLHG